ncbi:hypothetical protein CB0940_00471 [Cercospora beticola]|uniref:Uncharacterized protein n=1 Tax=Cercospora beticola TaxID=122368 RepID=A0A2G5IAJ1_CERBT|nr:hypothetical protein CB0940_00471 [Cercospora beticola]PIB01770.1 hypothetical protein CB0940_00471 [Cercospora beticola]WPA95887.1 hypothetical protein RHO25_000491 [Cercospora beticola]CAK1355852.1 unnamed protein product [Cercospora beticola]
MAGNNNVTVAMPGQPNWEIWWQWSKFDNFQLDIVGFLALLGEGAVLANAQVSALSRLSFLPRLIPAPQALIRTTRPVELPRTAGKVTGVHSGNTKPHVHHVAHILLQTNPPMPSYTVRCVELKVKKNEKREPTFLDKALRGQPNVPPELRKQADEHPELRAPLVKAKATGPQTWVALIGFLEAVILLISSIVFGDGMSLLATISLSLLSTVVGISNKWTLKLPTAASNSTKGDLVVRYPNGSFLVVKCEEVVARALYFAPEEIDYLVQNPIAYQMLSLLGTILLMLGIVFLANAKLQLQFAWAGAYVLINISHWVAAALPESWHWDVSCFEIKEQGVQGGWKSDNFTVALWKAILITKAVEWVPANEAAPKTGVWSDWVNKAEEEALNHETHDAPMEDSIWNPKGVETTIWDGPDEDDQSAWNPKQVWDELAKEAATRKGQAAEPKEPGITEDSATDVTDV